MQTAETVCEYLGRGLACVAAVVDPECFLIGGGVSKAGKYFTDLIGKYYQACISPKPRYEDCDGTAW